MSWRWKVSQEEPDESRVEIALRPFPRAPRLRLPIRVCMTTRRAGPMKKDGRARSTSWKRDLPEERLHDDALLLGHSFSTSRFIIRDVG